MALRNLGVEFERYKICEWEVNASLSYKAIHFPYDHCDYSADFSKNEIIRYLYTAGISNDGKKPMSYESIERKNEKWLRQVFNAMVTTTNGVDVTRISGKALEIVDTDKYDYVITWSFPCTDLSIQGKMQGMAKGSGTNSSVVWEVERILRECKEVGELPKVLLMENVPQVISDKNIDSFKAMCRSLHDLGYTHTYKILNAKDFGVPQNRKRCYMVSILGDETYEFPKEIQSDIMLKDILEKDVDEKYYIPNDKIKKIDSC